MKRDHFFHGRVFKCEPYIIDNRYKNKNSKYNILQAKGGITIAVILNKNNTLSWGFAKCNIEDVYSKKTGRDIAISRAKLNSIITKNPEYKIVRNVCEKIATLLYNKKHSTLHLDSNYLESFLVHEETKFSNLM